MTAVAHDLDLAPGFQMEEGEARQSWMISFADLMAILLCFMIMSFAMRQVDENVWDGVAKGLQVTFDDAVPPKSAAVSEAERKLEGAYIGDLFVTYMPGLVEEDRLLVGADGEVSLDLVGLQTDLHPLSDIVQIANAVKRDVFVEVSDLAPAADAGDIQRRLAWERVIADAVSRASALQDAGLKESPRISASLGGEAETASMTLLATAGEGNRP